MLLDFLVELSDVSEEFIGLGRDQVEPMEELVVGSHILNDYRLDNQ